MKKIKNRRIRNALWYLADVGDTSPAEIGRAATRYLVNVEDIRRALKYGAPVDAL